MGSKPRGTRVIYPSSDKGGGYPPKTMMMGKLSPESLASDSPSNTI